MQPFEYIRADEADAAIALVGGDPDAQYLAGGTTQLVSMDA
jgi:CO/xanthine dehydrogenase FAD-binding subunit